MRRHKRSRASAGSPSVDPLFVEQLSGRRRGSGGRESSRLRHKTLQLCRQVERALSLALAGECNDDVLRSTYVESVTPAPDASRLLVRLVVPASPGASVEEVLRRVERVHPILRAEVARAITRKRAPELTFLPMPDAGEVTP